MQSRFLISENPAYHLLNSAIANDKAHHAYLLSGPEGSGQTALALHFAFKILCKSENERPCLECRACKKALDYSHPDLRIVFPFVSENGFGEVMKKLREEEDSGTEKKPRAKKRKKEPGSGESLSIAELRMRYLSEAAQRLLQDPFRANALSPLFADKNREITIEFVRELREEIMMPPTESPSLVYVFLEAERINPSAANAFLKSLEEPPPYARFFLVTSRISTMLPTIRSRCQEVKLQGLTQKELLHFLIENRRVDPVKAARAGRFASGSVATALEILDEDNQEMLGSAMSFLEWLAQPTLFAAQTLSAQYSESPFTESMNRIKFMAIFFREVLTHQPLTGDGAFETRFNALLSRLAHYSFEEVYRRLMVAHDALEKKSNPRMAHLALFLSFLQ